MDTPPNAPSWATTSAPAATPVPPSTQAAGWYADPWNQAVWRWYDGRSWTAHLNLVLVEEKKPRLPSFLSVPVLVAALPSLAMLVYALVTNPKTVGLGLVPFVIVAPVLVWMDRLEPEPWSSRLHTFLWGAFVAGLISLIANTVFALATGSETLAAVISAPLVEELTKAAAIVWMVRRKEVDGIMDGLVYAGWAALGFAIVEDVSYFYLADEQDILWETFVGRALFTPFAHPLFTAWTGLAIGLAVRNRKSLWTAWWGLALAIGSHAAWNGSLSLAETEGGVIVTGVVIVGFILLFIATIIGVIILQRRDMRRTMELLPHIATRYNIPAERASMLVDRRARRAARKALPDKAARRRFDDEASAVVRLAAMLDHDGIGSPEHEARLVSQLVAARQP